MTTKKLQVQDLCRTGSLVAEVGGARLVVNYWNTNNIDSYHDRYGSGVVLDSLKLIYENPEFSDADRVIITIDDTKLVGSKGIISGIGLGVDEHWGGPFSGEVINLGDWVSFGTYRYKRVVKRDFLDRRRGSKSSFKDYTPRSWSIRKEAGYSDLDKFCGVDVLFSGRDRWFNSVNLIRAVPPYALEEFKKHEKNFRAMVGGYPDLKKYLGRFLPALLRKQKREERPMRINYSYL